MISVSQYLKEVSSGSYDYDDREFLAEFLDVKYPKVTHSKAIIPNNYIAPNIKFNDAELNALYNICGYILNSIKKTLKYALIAWKPQAPERI